MAVDKHESLWQMIARERVERGQNMKITTTDGAYDVVTGPLTRNGRFYLDPWQRAQTPVDDLDEIAVRLGDEYVPGEQP